MKLIIFHMMVRHFFHLVVEIMVGMTMHCEIAEEVDLKGISERHLQGKVTKVTEEDSGIIGSR